MNFLQDIRAAAKTFSAVRAARKAGATGAEIRVRPVHTAPVFTIPYWTQTVEATLLHDEPGRAGREVFNTFDEDVQHALTFAPKDGEWVDRVRFWQPHLKPALSPKQYHQAMTILIQGCIRCVRRRREAASA